MPLSQDELRTLVAKQKIEGQSVTEQYGDPNMKGFEKQLVDRLLEDRNREETDLRFVYKLASLKLVQRITKDTTSQTTAIQTILKRVYTRENDRLPRFGPSQSSATAGSVPYISPFGPADDNEKEYATQSQRRMDYVAQTYSAREVCISLLEVFISFVLVFLESAISVLEGLYAQYISYRSTLHQKREADSIISHGCLLLLDVLLTHMSR